jgi:hypothetical protein
MWMWCWGRKTAWALTGETCCWDCIHLATSSCIVVLYFLQHIFAVVFFFLRFAPGSPATTRVACLCEDFCPAHMFSLDVKLGQTWLAVLSSAGWFTGVERSCRRPTGLCVSLGFSQSSLASSSAAGTTGLQLTATGSSPCTGFWRYARLTAA